MLLKRFKISKDNRVTLRLFWPVLVEQTLGVTIGIVSAMMVSGVGDFAVSGVSLVDSINFLILAFFQAIAVGATVIVAQKIGAQKTEDAGETAYQSIVFCVLFAALFGVAVIFTGRYLLGALYGTADANVLEAGWIYFMFSGISYPFIGLFSACSGVMRAGGENRPPMIASVIANIVNISLAFILIRLGYGVYGVSAAMLIARILSGCLTLFMLRKGVNGIFLPRVRPRLTMEILRPVLRVGVPSGIDAAIFQVARIVMVVFMAGMGTAALHAHAISNSLIGFIMLPGSALSVVAVTLVGQAYGARRFYTVRQLMKKICLYCSILLAVAGGIIFLLLNPLLALYSPSPETIALSRRLVLMMICLAPLFWSFSFCIPNMLRACGDAKATMYISVCSLILIRVTGAWFFGIFLDWGVPGVWMGMFSDWITRGLGFSIRAFSNAWNGGRKPVDEET